MLYISEKAIYNQTSKNKDNINQNIEFLIKDKDFIIYSEKSIQLLGEYNGIITKIEAINPNGLFLLEKNESIKNRQNLNNFNEYLFLFKKFNTIKYIEEDFSFLIDYKNIIIDFCKNSFEKINKSNNAIKYLKASIKSIYFVNYYYDLEFDNNIKNIYLVKPRSIFVSTSNKLEDILDDIKSIKINKKKSITQSGKNGWILEKIK